MIIKRVSPVKNLKDLRKRWKYILLSSRTIFYFKIGQVFTSKWFVYEIGLILMTAWYCRFQLGLTKAVKLSTILLPREWESKVISESQPFNLLILLINDGAISYAIGYPDTKFARISNEPIIRMSGIWIPALVILQQMQQSLNLSMPLD